MVNQSADERHGARIRDGLDEREGLNGWMDACMHACIAVLYCTGLCGLCGLCGLYGL